MDVLANGVRLRCLSIVDDFAEEIRRSGGGSQHLWLYVSRVLDQTAKFRGYPCPIRTDQGPRLTCIAQDKT